MVAIGVGTVTWVMLIAPYLDIADLDLKIKLTAMAYPVMDLLLAAAAIRLAVGAGRRPVAFYLLMASVVALFATDAIYAWFGLYTESGLPARQRLARGRLDVVLRAARHGRPAPVDAGADRTRPRDARNASPSARLVLLTVAALSPPVIRLVQLARGEEVDVGVLSAASIVLFLLVVLRMAGLIRQQERSAERERALREAGATLVTATSREGIHEAAIEAARALAGADAAIRMCDEPGAGDELVVVAAAGGSVDVARRALLASRSCRSGSSERLLDERRLRDQGVREHAARSARAADRRRRLGLRRAAVHQGGAARADGGRDARGDAALGRRLAAGAVVAGRPGARVAPRSPRIC